MIKTRNDTDRDGAVEDEELDEWVRRSRSGDLDAFDSLVRRFHGVILNLAIRMTEDREGAEDAAQEIFLKAWQNLPRFRGASRFSTWLHAVAVNHCLSLIKKRNQEISKIQPMTEQNTLGSYEDGFDSGFDMSRWVRSQILQEAILKLPETLSIVVVLHYYSDYSVQEISSVLGLPVRTIYFRLEKGKSRLEKELKGLWEGG